MEELDPVEHAHEELVPFTPCRHIEQCCPCQGETATAGHLLLKTSHPFAEDVYTCAHLHS
jgi:hypothetical protein